MRISCWIPRAIDAHLEYVILVVFPRQQWLHERASVLTFLHTSAVLFCTVIVLWYRNRCCKYMKGGVLAEDVGDRGAGEKIWIRGGGSLGRFRIEELHNFYCSPDILGCQIKGHKIGGTCGT